jgi:hypothetical protein
MKLKTRLYLLKRKTKQFFTYEIYKALYTSFLTICLFAFWVIAIDIGYVIVNTQATLDMATKHETDIPMCATKKTEIRENPTGFVLSEIKQGDVVWVVQLQVPFAVVWYSDGHSWYLGTTTASYLVPCDRIKQDAL